MSKLLDGKTAIVTGAAHGVGLAIARRFHREGALVMLADPDEDMLAKEARELDAEGNTASFFRCDPTTKLDTNNLLAATIDAFDQVDILVNATSEPCLGLPLEIDDDTFDRAISVNLRSAFLLSQLVGRHMVKRAEATEKGMIDGCILNVSALGGERSMPNRFALGISMAGLDQLTRGLSVSLATHGIRVNGIGPGGLAGRFAGLTEPEVRKVMLGRIPMGRLAEATEIAGVAAMLASANASYVTGQIVIVDGGRSIYERPIIEVSEDTD